MEKGRTVEEEVGVRGAKTAAALAQYRSTMDDYTDYFRQPVGDQRQLIVDDGWETLQDDCYDRSHRPGGCCTNDGW